MVSGQKFAALVERTTSVRNVTGGDDELDPSRFEHRQR